MTNEVSATQVRIPFETCQVSTGKGGENGRRAADQLTQNVRWQCRASLCRARASALLGSARRRAQRVEPEHERHEGQADVCDEGRRRHTSLHAAHVESAVAERAEHLEPRHHVGAVARELPLRHAQPGALRRHHGRGAERARRAEQPHGSARHRDSDPP
eukprot:scaffold43885_cov61-Phaeocystis_antarctica.AAC.4